MFRVFRSHLVLVALPVLLAAGCSANSATAPPVLGSSNSSLSGNALQASAPPTSSSYVYGCTGEPKCRVFTTDGQLVRTVSQGLMTPGGLAVDPQGNVYVAEEFPQEIDVYSSGMAARIQTLNNGSDVALDVAVHAGVVAVSDQHAVTVFAPGSTSNPSRLVGGNVLQGIGIAFDSKGNCYWSYSPDSGNGNSKVYEFAGCSGQAQAIDLPGSPASLAFDGNDNLYYSSDTFSETAGIFRCTGLTNCNRVFAKGRDPEHIRFDGTWTNLYAGLVKGHDISQIDVATGKIVKNIGHGFTNYFPPVGVAAGPGPE